MNKSSNVNQILKINTKTWRKYTEDLFDFEADDMTESEIKINQNDFNYFIFTQDDKIIVSKDLSEIKKKIVDGSLGKIVAEITNMSNGNFVVSNPLISNKLKSIGRNYLDRLWFVLEAEVPKQIEEGDVIKLGRVRLKIDKISLKNNATHLDTCYQNGVGINYLKTNININQLNNVSINMQNINTISNNNNNNNLLNITGYNQMTNANTNDEKSNKDKLLGSGLNSNLNILDDGKSKEATYICKICFRTDSDHSDPLISPCKCSGSMGYIHYKCLKQCIKMKITKKEAENYVCYLWKNYECEICLKEYPKYIRYKNHIYNMIDYNINYDEYIILDYTLYDDIKKRTFRKGIIIVKINNEENITIGRNQTNIIKLKDISVSRSHCYIFKKENKIYIADKGSKFGTLIYLNRPFTLTNNNNLKKINNKPNNFIDNQVNLISGKNYFSFKLSSNWSLFGSLFSNAFCCKCKNADEDYVLNLEDSIENIDNSKDGMEVNHFNDSYIDYFMNLDTIIKNSEPTNNVNNNNNNSFI